VGGGALLTGADSAYAQAAPPSPTPPAAAPAASPPATATPVAPRAPTNTPAPNNANTPAPRGAAPPARAQATPARPGAAAPAATPAAEQAPVIRRILVQGNQRVEPSTVISYMLVQPGDRFDSERVDLSLKTLFATNLFADVQIVQQDADLVVKVVENPIINRVVFEGLSAMRQEKLEKDLQAKPRAVFTAARAQADVQRIIELYRRSGRFAATVTPQVKELDQNRVDLIFKVDEGPVTHVRNINFIGNDAFSDGDLRGAIRTEQSHWWKFFSNNDNYDPDRIEYDRELLRQYYSNRGYADFRIVSAVAELTPDQKSFYITFTIDEGEKYTFGDVKVETELDKLPKELLVASVPIQSGREYQGELIEKSIDSLTFVAGTAGYANVEINPRYDRDRQNRKVNMTFEVNEGPRVFIERINVVGNTSTVDKVVRRELRLAEGDAFNRVLLDRSKQRVNALGYFKTVEVEDRPGSTADRSVIDVKVEEEATGQLAFAAGYSSSESLMFDISVEQRNLRGQGQYLRLAASTSAISKSVDLRFTDPRFLGRNLSAGVQLFTLRTDFLDQSSFSNQSTGGSVTFGFPLAESMSLSTTYTLREDDTRVASYPVFLTDGSLVDQCSPANLARSVLCDQSGRFLTSLGSYQFTLDKRNDPVKATRGYDIKLNQDLAGLGGDVKYLRSEVEATAYHGFTSTLIASFNLGAGYVSGLDGQDVRITDRFFKGGTSFRGFDVAGIGPRNVIEYRDSVTGDLIDRVKGDALGGKMYAIGTLQLEFPTGLPKEFGLGAALFTEFGTVGMLDPKDRRTITSDDGVTAVTSIIKDAAAFRASAGMSVFWDSPFGPVQFDFSHPLAKEDYDRAKSFRFSTRTRF
jgi:outer membrane protein insertion porin family